VKTRTYYSVNVVESHIVLRSLSRSTSHRLAENPCQNTHSYWLRSQTVNIVPTYLNVVIGSV